MSGLSTNRLRSRGSSSRGRNRRGRKNARSLRIGRFRASPRLVLGVGVGLALAVGFVGVEIARRHSNSFEEFVGDAISDLRVAVPGLVDPISRLEDQIHESCYRLGVWVHHRGPGTGSSSAADPRHRTTTEPPAEGAATTEAPATDTDTNDAPASGATGNGSIPNGAGPSQGVFGKSGIVPTPSLEELSAEVPPSASPKERIILDAVNWNLMRKGPTSWSKEAWLVANPAFPYDPSLVLHFDRRRSQIIRQPGSRNPWNMTPAHQMLKDASPPPDRTGKIPQDARSDTLIAFGGGFESIHFYNYGAIYQGRVVVPLTPGIQTLAIYTDGTIRMAPWQSAELPTAGIVEARQNLPPLVRHGKIPGNITSLNSGTLSATYTLDSDNRRVYTDVHTWRSGLGLTADGDLVYCFGPRLTPRLLAAALIRAGAVEAMMLDINAAYHCAPSLVVPTSDGQGKLLPVFPKINMGQRFLQGSRKDFFYFRPVHGQDAGTS